MCFLWQIFVGVSKLCGTSRKQIYVQEYIEEVEIDWWVVSVVRGNK